MQLDEFVPLMKEFGRVRERDDPADAFGLEEYGFHYVHQSCMTVVLVQQMEGYWLLETAACARVGLSPELALFRRVARWGTTSGIVSPNVVENDAGEIAVLVTGLTSIDALAPGHDGVRYVVQLIDATNLVAQRLGSDLEQFGGRYLEQAGISMRQTATEVHGWWSVQDRDILGRLR